MPSQRSCGLTGNEASLSKARDAFLSQLVKLLEEALVISLEVETGLALHLAGGSIRDRANGSSWRRTRLESYLLLCQLRPESHFPLGYVPLVACRIDERSSSPFFQPRVFRLQIEVTTVRAQKNVDRQRFEDSESVGSRVGGAARVAGDVVCACDVVGCTAANSPINREGDNFISLLSFDSQCFPELQSSSGARY